MIAAIFFIHLTSEGIWQIHYALPFAGICAISNHVASSEYEARANAAHDLAARGFRVLILLKPPQLAA